MLFLRLLLSGSTGSRGNDAPGSGRGTSNTNSTSSPNRFRIGGSGSEPIGRTTIAAELTLPGALTLNENRTAVIAPLVAGQISSVRVDVGSRVTRGQILATMNSPEFTRAQTQFLQAFAQAELSRNDFERAQSLRETRAIEEREFLRRQAVYEQALAERRAAEVVLHSLGSR